MGDAYLQSNGTNARLRFEHSLDQEKYIFWKFNFLKNIFTSSAIVKINRIHPLTKQEYKKDIISKYIIPSFRYKLPH